jgi:hypothetical protein
MSPYVRTVKTGSGATAVQIVYSSHRGSREIEHLGSAHTGAQVELLKAAARQRLAAGQGELDLGLAVGAPGGPLPITALRMSHLLDALTCGYRVLGFDGATGGDEVFFQLVLARVIEPTSKLDAARVLEEAGLDAVSYRTVKRRLPEYAKQPWRQRLSAACAAHAGLGPASLVLYDCSTLYFETDTGDGFREPGFSKERRLEPQITIGLLTDQSGFPLMVSAFEGNKAETKTMVPVIKEFMAAHRLPDVTVVADAGMVSEANQKQIEAAGLSFILGQRIPEVPGSSLNGTVSTLASRSLTGMCSPSAGPPGRTAAAATRSSTTSTATTGHGAPCAASTSRSPRLKTPSRAGHPSSGTGSSPWTAPPTPSTVNWKPRPGRSPGSRATSPTCKPAPTAPPSPRTS